MTEPRLIPVSPELAQIIREVNAEAAAAVAKQDVVLRTALAALGIPLDAVEGEVGLRDGNLIVHMRAEVNRSPIEEPLP